PEQLVRDAQFFNSGPPPELLRRAFVTPNDLFFTRSHGPVPFINPETFRLEVGGLVERPLQLDLATIRSAMPRQSIAATMACAGLRRDELQAYRPIPGEVAWGAEPVSNGVWTGVPLRDILLAAGLAPQAAHVEFTGLDEVIRHGETFGFGGSIPLEKAMSQEVLLAFDLNGETLPPAHGFPLRAVVPGCIGARSVKWLSRITVTDHASENYFQAHAYKTFPPEITAETVRWKDGFMLHDLPLNAVIWSPLPGQGLSVGQNLIEGWAMASAGKTIARVEVSPDGGATWVDAHLSEEGNRWTWRFWSARLSLASGGHTLVARATDSEGNCQPEAVDRLWNFKGYMNNAWHRVNVGVA
ncbi:MAG: sulfite oxidase, partial [Gemmatimonadota bacterium]